MSKKYTSQVKSLEYLRNIMNRLNYVENKSHPVMVGNNLLNCGGILAKVNLRNFTFEERSDVMGLITVLMGLDFACFSSVKSFSYAIKDALKIASNMSLKYEESNKKLFRLVTPVAYILNYSDSYINSIVKNS